MLISPIKYPVLYSLLKDSVSVDTETKVDDGFLKFSFELSIKLPEPIAQLFD